ncbi:hypothetical protein L6164_020111 [Bauhinia variegata]|uniref:Uncharacterized protein n=1 Tax=Bauhinia variegata TaxID=167791 RepID=A0ACB9MUD1_BAUVA|nr:hypothetical protein L6164_020111 [Bauhinia variegata]
MEEVDVKAIIASLAFTKRHVLLGVGPLLLGSVPIQECRNTLNQLSFVFITVQKSERVSIWSLYKCHSSEQMSPGILWVLRVIAQTLGHCLSASWPSSSPFYGAP